METVGPGGCKGVGVSGKPILCVNRSLRPEIGMHGLRPLLEKTR